jgi:hypothetical protein
MRMRASESLERMDPLVLARLLGALESVETTRDLIGEVREVDAFGHERPELRRIADLVAAARDALYAVIFSERTR